MYYFMFVNEWYSILQLFKVKSNGISSSEHHSFKLKSKLGCVFLTIASFDIFSSYPSVHFHFLKYLLKNNIAAFSVYCSSNKIFISNYGSVKYIVCISLQKTNLKEIKCCVTNDMYIHFLRTVRSNKNISNEIHRAQSTYSNSVIPL